ncbi:hypothetical protein IJT17_09355 [bacterium]|nr:hypothetical protein [bacterium]
MNHAPNDRSFSANIAANNAKTKEHPQHTHYRWITALAVITSVMLIAGTACSNWFKTKTSPFSGLLPQSTPLVIEGTASDVIRFLRQLGIEQPSLGENQDLDSLQCERLLYAAIPSENSGDFSACKRNILKNAKAIEESWSAQLQYPEQQASSPQLCPYGGKLAYESSGQSFTISCTGADHQTVYNSTNGLSTRTTDSPPLIFIAFQSQDPRWQDAAVSKKHPDIKILASDPERTVKLLEEQAEQTLTINYSSDTALYANVLNSKLSFFWHSLPIKLPGERTIITKNAETGVYSLRADMALPTASEDSADPQWPASDTCLAELPKASTYLAASCELLQQINLLPAALNQPGAPEPQVFGFATNASVPLSHLLQTVSSGFAGLTQACYAAQFSDSATAQQSMANSPWGDISQSGNPHCQGTLKDRTVTVNIGGKLPETQSEPAVFPVGPGPSQMAGRLTVLDYAQTQRTYLFSGGVKKNQLWIEVKPDGIPTNSAY